MHCETCKGAIRFVEGSWQHVAATKCVAVVVAWPEQPAANPDAA